MTHIALFFLKHSNRLNTCFNLEKALDTYFYFMAIKDKFNKEYINIIRGRFLIGEAEGSNLPLIDKKFIISDEIYKLLDTISKGQAERHTIDIMEEYSLFDLPTIKTFFKHMEYVLQ